MISAIEAGALVLARVLLIAVFAFAGVAKFADREGTKRAIVEFGAPQSLVAPLAIALPAAELTIALSLLASGAMRFGAIAALVLTCAFIAAIGANLAKGRRPNCHCFGNLHSAPIGVSTLSFNIALALAALFLIWRGSAAPGLFAWIGDLTPGFNPGAERVSVFLNAAALATIAALGALLWQTLRQQGRMLLRIEELEERVGARVAHRGLPIGAPAPDFALEDIDGELVTLAALQAKQKPILLIFTHPRCGPCQSLLPEIAQWRAADAHATIALVSEGAARDNLAHRGAGPILLQRAREVADAYQAWGTPSAVLVGATGRIASAVAAGAGAVRRLAEQVVERGARSDPYADQSARPGEPAGLMELSDRQ